MEVMAKGKICRVGVGTDKQYPHRIQTTHGLIFLSLGYFFTSTFMALIVFAVSVFYKHTTSILIFSCLAWFPVLSNCLDKTIHSFSYVSDTIVFRRHFLIHFNHIPRHIFPLFTTDHTLQPLALASLVLQMSETTSRISLSVFINIFKKHCFDLNLKLLHSHIMGFRYCDSEQYF